MSDAGSGGRRDIELRIRAVDTTQADMRRLVQSINDVSNALAKELEAAAAGKRSSDELRQSITQLEAAHKGLTGIGALVDQFKNLTAQITASQEAVAKSTTAYNAYQAEIEQTEKVTKAQEQSLGRLNRERERAERTLTQQQTMLASVGTDLRRAGVDTASLSQAERELVAASEQLGAALVPLREAHASNSRVIREHREETARLRDEEKKATEEARKLAQAEKEAADARARAAQQEVKAEREASEARALAAEQSAALEADRLKQIAIREQLSRAQAQREQAARMEAIGAERRSQQTLNTVRAEARAKIAAEDRAFTEQQWRLRESDDAVRRRRLEAAIEAEGKRRPVQQPTPVGGGAGAGQQTLFGLRPYELQNLSYQLNDVVTQLGSGVNLTQVIAQQGGQVLQLWAKNIFDLVRYLPAVAVGITTVSVAVASLNRAFEDIGSTREFNAQFRLMADGTNFSGEAITKLRREVRGLGIDFAQSGQLINTGLRAGFKESDLRPFLVLARNIADARPELSLADAGKLLADNLGQGYAGVQRLNEVLQLLNGTELDNIRRMFEHGHAADAMRQFIDKLSQAAANAAKNALSPMAEASRAAGTAWTNLTEAISKTRPFEVLIDWITQTATAVRDWTKAINENQEARDKAVKIAEIVGGGLVGAAGGAAVGGLPGAVVGGALGAGAAAVGVDAASKPGVGPVMATAPIPAAGGVPGGTVLTHGPRYVPTIDTADLEAIVRAALAYMPGGSAEITSGLAGRPGRPGSQHPRGDAIDVRLMIDGKEVPGFMGVDASGQYGKLFANMLAVQQRFFPKRSGLASGTEFETEDAGHFDFGGRRGLGRNQGTLPANLAFGDTQGPPAPLGVPSRAADITKINEQTDAMRRQLDIVHAATEAQEKQAKIAEFTAKNSALAKGTTEEQAAFQKQLALEATKIDEEQLQKRVEYDHKLTEARITDGARFKEIYQAGVEFADKYRAMNNGVLGIDRQRALILEGMAEKRTAFARVETIDNDRRALAAKYAELDRANTLKDYTSLEVRLRGVDDQYNAIARDIEKHKRTLSDVPLPFDETKLAAAKETQQQIVTNQFYMDKTNSIIKERNTLIQTYQALLDKGLMTQTEFEEKQKAATLDAAPKIKETTAAWSEFLKTATKLDTTTIDLATAKIKELGSEVEYISPLMKELRATFASSFGSNAANAFNTISEAIGGLIAKTKTWADVWKSARVAAANFFAGLLKDLANTILKYELNKLASSILGINLGGGSSTTLGGGGGFLSFLFGGGGGTASGIAAGTGAGAGISTNLATGVTSDIVGGGVAAPSFLSTLFSAFHTGGVVGQGGTPRPVGAWQADWSRAPRYHNGSVIGLAPDEQAAILKHGEEVLSADNPRNIMRGGGQASGINIRNVLVDDPRRIPEAMSGSVGERVIVQTLVRNAATIRELVKG